MTENVTTESIVDDTPQETTLKEQVSAGEGLEADNLAVCHLCGNGYLISKGCKHQALTEKKPQRPFKLPILLEWRKCEWCRNPLVSREKTVCKTCRDVLKSKR